MSLQRLVSHTKIATLLWWCVGSEKSRFFRTTHVIFELSSLNCHLWIVIIELSSLNCHLWIVILQLSSFNCHHQFGRPLRRLLPHTRARMARPRQAGVATSPVAPTLDWHTRRTCCVCPPAWRDADEYCSGTSTAGWWWRGRIATVRLRCGCSGSRSGCTNAGTSSPECESARTSLPCLRQPSWNNLNLKNFNAKRIKWNPSAGVLSRTVLRYCNAMGALVFYTVTLCHDEVCSLGVQTQCHISIHNRAIHSRDNALTSSGSSTGCDNACLGQSNFNCWQSDWVGMAV